MFPPTVCSYFFPMVIPIDPLPFADGVGLTCCLKSPCQSQGGMIGGHFAASLGVVKHASGLPLSVLCRRKAPCPLCWSPKSQGPQQVTFFLLIFQNLLLSHSEACSLAQQRRFGRNWSMLYLEMNSWDWIYYNSERIYVITRYSAIYESQYSNLGLSQSKFYVLCSTQLFNCHFLMSY